MQQISENENDEKRVNEKKELRTNNSFRNSNEEGKNLIHLQGASPRNEKVASGSRKKVIGPHRKDDWCWKCKRHGHSIDQCWHHNKSRPQQHCKLHGRCSHTTDECWTVERLIHRKSSGHRKFFHPEH